MRLKRKIHPEIKESLHPRNVHNRRYNFEQLMAANPELEEYVYPNHFREKSVDFSDPKAVKELNKALLMKDYGIEFWDIPEGYLCPPVPGRADYIHNMADLLAASNGGAYPEGERVLAMDIGVGANGIFPIIGAKEYGMYFIGTDIDKPALDNAINLVKRNPILQGKFELRLQTDPRAIFKGVLKETERIDVVISNPPFHDSADSAAMSNQRKRNKLTKGKKDKARLNFGGRNNELWCEGGEYRFVSNIIAESKDLGKQVLWFSSLVSKSSYLKGFEKQLIALGVKDMKVIPMGQGSKISRVLAWTYQDEKERSSWRKTVTKAAKPAGKLVTKRAAKPVSEPVPEKVTTPLKTEEVSIPKKVAAKKVTKPAKTEEVSIPKKVVAKKVTKPTKVEEVSIPKKVVAKKVTKTVKPEVETTTKKVTAKKVTKPAKTEEESIPKKVVAKKPAKAAPKSPKK